MTKLTDIKYKFEALTPVEYKLSITLPTTNKLMGTLLTNALRRFKAPKTKGIDSVNYIPLPPVYLPSVTRFIGGVVKDLAKGFDAKGIYIQNHTVTSGEFIRKDKDNWDINLEIEGRYDDRR